MGSTEMYNSKEVFSTKCKKKSKTDDLLYSTGSIVEIQNKFLTASYRPVQVDNCLEQLEISTEIELLNKREGNILPFPNANTLTNVNMNEFEKWLTSNYFRESDYPSWYHALSDKSNDRNHLKICDIAKLHRTNNSPKPEEYDDQMDPSINKSETNTIVPGRGERDSNKPERYTSSETNENDITSSDSTESTVLFVQHQESRQPSEDLSKSPLDQLPKLSPKDLVREWLNTASSKSQNVFRSCKACAIFSAKKYEVPKGEKACLKRDFASMSKSERLGELERIYGKKVPQVSFATKLKKTRPEWKF